MAKKTDGYSKLKEMVALQKMFGGKTNDGQVAYTNAIMQTPSTGPLDVVTKGLAGFLQSQHTNAVQKGNQDMIQSFMQQAQQQDMQDLNYRHQVAGLLDDHDRRNVPHDQTKKELMQLYLRTGNEHALTALKHPGWTDQKSSDSMDQFHKGMLGLQTYIKNTYGDPSTMDDETKARMAKDPAVLHLTSKLRSAVGVTPEEEAQYLKSLQAQVSPGAATTTAPAQPNGFQALWNNIKGSIPGLGGSQDIGADANTKTMPAANATDMFMKQAMAAPADQGDPLEGKTAFNKKTGERLIRKGGQWQKAA